MILELHKKSGGNRGTRAVQDAIYPRNSTGVKEIKSTSKGKEKPVASRFQNMEGELQNLTIKNSGSLAMRRDPAWALKLCSVV